MTLREVWRRLHGGRAEMGSPDGRAHATVSITPSCLSLVERKAGDTGRLWGRGRGEGRSQLHPKSLESPPAGIPK